MTEATEIETLAATVRAGLMQDEHLAREACGGTVVGSAYNWRQAPGGDEWEASISPHGDEELLVALRPGLPRPPEVMSGYWGAVVSQTDRCDPDTRSPMPAFRRMARHDPAAILARVARDRAVVDLLLAEEHADSCGFRRDDPDEWPCECNRDHRVTAYLALLAQPYTEAT